MGGKKRKKTDKKKITLITELLIQFHWPVFTGNLVHAD